MDDYNNLSPTQTASVLQGGAVPSSTAPPIPDSYQNQALAMLDRLNNQRKSLEIAQVDALKQVAAGQKQTQGIVPNIKQPGEFQKASLDNRQVVGHHNAKMQGIGNTIVAAANLVGAYENKVAQQKATNLSNTIQTLYGAMDGKNEASQRLQQGDKSAQGDVEHNQKVIDSILSDDKKRKAIGKALQIDFTNPNNNNSPDQKAGQMATQNYTKQLEAAMPTRNVPNEQAQQRALLIQQQMQGVDKLTADTLKLIDSDKKQEHQDLREDTKEENAFKIAKMNNEARYETALSVAKAHNDGQMAVTIVKEQRQHENRLAEIDERYRQIEKLKTSAGMLNTPSGIATQNKRTQLLISSIKTLSDAIKNGPITINNLKIQRDSAPPERKELYNLIIQTQESQIQQYQQRLDAYTADLDSIEGTTYAPANAGSSARSSKSSQPITSNNFNFQVNPADDSETESGAGSTDPDAIP